VSVSDPCLGQGIPCPGTSLWVARTLLGGIRTPSKGPDTLTWKSRTVFGGSGLCVQGSGASPWRSGPTDCILGYIIFSGHVAPLSPSTWWGQVFVRHTTKDSRMDIAPSYCSKGYPFSRVLTMPTTNVFSSAFLC
jgi:hypothetical protein